MEYQQTENTQNLLEDESILLNQYEYASTGQRFLNWLIDNLLMNYGLSYATGYGIGIMIATLFPDMVESIQEKSTAFYVLVYSIVIANYLLYYIICEKLFNGYTLGKIITGTKAIREDGTPLTLKDAFLRTVTRLVPFEVFSGFKIRAWHDEWSNTMVVKAR